MRPAGLQQLAVDVFTDDQRVVIHDYPGNGAIGTYERGAVRIQDSSGASRHVRRNGRPRVTKLWWDDLDFLYFVGCALWNYVAVPTMLRRLPHRELPAWGEGQHRWRRVQVRFPPEILTHSSLQTFYLDDEERIMRHDYVAEVFGPWALAAHYGHHHVPLGDRWVATRRRVVPRTPAGRALPAPTLVSIAMDELRQVLT